MNFEFCVKSFTICILIAIGYATSFAQVSPPKIREIKEITPQKPKGVDIGKRENTNKVQRKKPDLMDWKDTAVDTLLYFNDSLRIENSIRVNLRVKTNLHDYTNVFLPDSIDSPRDDAKYVIIRDPDPGRAGNVAFKIVYGSIISDVKKGSLTLVAGELLTVVSSRALYIVNRDTTGLIYLEKGTVTFPEHTGADTLKDGQILRFEGNRIIGIVPALGAVALNNFIKFNNSTIWKAPLWQKPLFWVGTGVAVGAVTRIFIFPPKNGGNDLPGPPGVPQNNKQNLRSNF